MIKLLTFNNLFSPLSYHFDIPAKTRGRVTRCDDGYHFFPPKWRWFTREHYLISTEKISYSLSLTRWNLNLSIITSRTKRHVLLDNRKFLLLSCSCFFFFVMFWPQAFFKFFPWTALCDHFMPRFLESSLSSGSVAQYLFKTSQKMFFFRCKCSWYVPWNELSQINYQKTCPLQVITGHYKEKIERKASYYNHISAKEQSARNLCSVSSPSMPSDEWCIKFSVHVYAINRVWCDLADKSCKKK